MDDLNAAMVLALDRAQSEVGRLKEEILTLTTKK